MNILKKDNKLFWIYFLSASIYGCQGIEGLPSTSLFFYLKETLHLDVSTIMYLSLITSIAWGVKPIYGFFCDNFLTKKAWILISLIGSLLICLFMGLNSLLILPILILLMSTMSLTTAVRDVANDGIMCVEGKESNSCDKIQTVQWTAITIAGIIVSLGGGYIADHFNYKIAYLCLIPIYLIIIAIVLRYRTTVSKNRTVEPACGSCKYKESCSGNDNHICENYKKENKKVSILETICSYKELFTNKQFLLGALFLFIYNFAPGYGTPLMFIQRDTFHWSGSFMGLIGAISSVMSIIGAIIYFKFSKKINVKKCLFYSVFIVGIINLSYLYFTPVTAIIYSCIFSVLGMFIFLNLMSFMAKSTLSGKEATSFALLCSVNNLAGTASTLVGAWLFPLIGLKVIIILASLSAFLSLPILKRLEIK
jgi:MFS family permease